MVEAILQVGDENGPLEGEFGYGELVANATVRLRGFGASTKQQKSYRIDIKDGKGKWEGQKTIVLNKDFSDAVRFHNKLAYSLMLDVDHMLSVRTSFVHLYVKDKTEGEDGLFRDYGLFTQVEQVNKTYLKNHDFDNDGQLYKAEDFDWGRHEDGIVPATDPNFDLNHFEQYLEIKGSDDHTKLIALLDAVNDETLPASKLVEQYFEPDNLYNWMAFQILTGNKDEGTGSYYLYSPSIVDKWYIISWNNSGAFSETYKKMRDASYENSWNTGIFTYTDAVLFNRILKDEKCRKRLDQAVEELSPGQYFVRVRAISDGGLTQDAYEYYRTEQKTTIYSVQCFYVLEDGSIVVSYYEDE